MLRPLHWCATLLGLALVLLLAQHRGGSTTTEVWIDRPPTAVWPVLTDTAAYPAWNPIIKRIDGQLRESASIRVTTQTRHSGSGTYRGHVLTIEPFRELRWQGSHSIPGLLTDERSFQLEAIGTRTHLIQTVQSSGLLFGRLTDGLFADTAFQMDDLNQAIKQRVEASSR